VRRCRAPHRLAAARRRSESRIFRQLFEPCMIHADPALVSSVKAFTVGTASRLALSTPAMWRSTTCGIVDEALWVAGEGSSFGGRRRMSARLMLQAALAARTPNAAGRSPVAPACRHQNCRTPSVRCSNKRGTRPSSSNRRRPELHDLAARMARAVVPRERTIPSSKTLCCAARARP